MSLLGKLLAIFNVLAAIAFVSVASLDWSKWHSWKTAVFLQELVADGLPLDDKETNADGKPLVELVTDNKKTLDDLFANAGGNPVKTQVDEVKRVKDLLIQEPNKASVLLPFATTSVEYEELALGKVKEEDLLKRFNDVFDAALLGNVSGHALNIDERKLAAARLLVNLIGVEKSVTLPRVLAVCGMSNTIRAMETQTQLMLKLTDDLAYAIGRDRDEFVIEQNRAIAQVLDLADELRRQNRFLTIQQELVSRQTNLVNGLKNEIDQKQPPSANQPLPLGLQQRLAAAKDAVDANLKIQAKMEQSLFDARKQLRDLGELNAKLEQQLRERDEKAKTR